jgi:hypothetical protein
VKPRSRQKQQGRRESGTFVALPHAVLDSANWRNCSASAIKLLCELARQFNGHNNGNLCATLSKLKPRGWRSSDTISGALKELRYYGLIVLTRQGGLHGPSLFALTWLAIDDCGGKLEMPPTNVAPGEWKQVRSRYKRAPKGTRSEGT